MYNENLILYTREWKNAKELIIEYIGFVIIRVHCYKTNNELPVIFCYWCAFDLIDVV